MVCDKGMRWETFLTISVTNNYFLAAFVDDAVFAAAAAAAAAAFKALSCLSAASGSTA
jgi:hypothetical protein